MRGSSPSSPAQQQGVGARRSPGLGKALPLLSTSSAPGISKHTPRSSSPLTKSQLLET